MLNRTGNAHRYVQIGRDDLTGLADLELVRNKTRNGLVYTSDAADDLRYVSLCRCMYSNKKKHNLIYRLHRICAPLRSPLDLP